MVKNKCKGCTDRKVGCHVTCESYQEFKREADERREARRIDIDAQPEWHPWHKHGSSHRHR